MFSNGSFVAVVPINLTKPASFITVESIALFPEVHCPTAVTGIGIAYKSAYSPPKSGGLPPIP